MEDRCCLHDPDTKDFQCIADTFGGSRCKNYINKKSPYCKLHNKRCFQLYRQYKNICDRLSDWKKKNIKDLTDAQLERDIRVAEDCKRLRFDHFVECYALSHDDVPDPGHLGAIKYADDVARLAGAELYKRGKRF